MAAAWFLLQYLMQMSIVIQAAMSAHNYLPLIRNTKSVSVVEFIHLSSPPTAQEERLVRVLWTNTYSVNEYQSTFIKALLFTVNDLNKSFNHVLYCVTSHHITSQMHWFNISCFQDKLSFIISLSLFLRIHER